MISEQLAKNTVDSKKVDDSTSDAEMLRLAMQAELDAVSLYEQMAATTSNEDFKKVFLDVANEEKVHLGEFEEMLKIADPTHDKYEDEGGEEAKEKTS